MKNGIAIGVLVIGILLGLYSGIWWAFIGGIIQIIEQVRAVELNSLQVALGVLKIMLSGFIGYGVSMIFIGLATIIYES